MKLMITMSFLLLSSVAMASAPESSHESQVDYQSWCEGDKVTTWDDGDLPMTQWDCYGMTEKGSCVESAEKEGDITIVTATCE